MEGRIRGICKTNVHRASYSKHLRSKEHLEHSEIIRQDDIIIPEWYFKEEQTPIKKKTKKLFNPQTLKRIARENSKVDDKKLDKELAKKIINPSFFKNENLKTGFKISLDSLSINHANSILSIIPIYRAFGIETRHNIKTSKETATAYTRLLNQ